MDHVAGDRTRRERHVARTARMTAAHYYLEDSGYLFRFESYVRYYEVLTPS
jgi:hypothetical protein